MEPAAFFIRGGGCCSIARNETTELLFVSEVKAKEFVQAWPTESAWKRPVAVWVCVLLASAKQIIFSRATAFMNRPSRWLRELL
jgi:hypothetical protein